MIPPELSTVDEVFHLSEDKFNKRKLSVVKRTLKKRKVSIGGRDKVEVEGYDEHRLWDVSTPKVSIVEVKTSIIIVGMDLAS